MADYIIDDYKMDFTGEDALLIQIERENVRFEARVTSYEQFNEDTLLVTGFDDAESFVLQNGTIQDTGDSVATEINLPEDFAGVLETRIKETLYDTSNSSELQRLD